MKSNPLDHVISILTLLGISSNLIAAEPLGTAFTYQGQLAGGGQAANGIYDFRFTIYDAVANGNHVGEPLTNATVTLNNGLFATQLDFGENAFAGEARWLEIAVRTNGSSTAYHILLPRQLLTGAPYAVWALRAGSVSDGAITSASLANDSVGGDKIADGSVRLADLSQNGAADGQVIRWSAIDNAWVPGPASGANTTLSYSENGPFAPAPLASGAGAIAQGQHAQATGNGSVVGGGLDNLASHWYTTVGGGWSNIAAGLLFGRATIGGGEWNQALGDWSTVGGGQLNIAGGSLWGRSTVAGGWENQATGDLSTVSGGSQNRAVIGHGAIGGGQFNVVSNGAWSVVGGGYSNRVLGMAATIPGGAYNEASGRASLAAGRRARALHDGAFVWADTSEADFKSSAPNQFLIRATGGVGILTDTPVSALHVNGVVTGTGFQGNGALPWQVVSGTAQIASPNTAYMANNAAQVAILLPASPALGDIIRVSGAGTGGWKIHQNAGQSIYTKQFLGAGMVWTPHESNRPWQAVASSADGSKLVAVGRGIRIYTSTDSGVTWTPRESVRDWIGVASSADGTKLVAVAFQGQIYTSTDSGANWVARENNRLWLGVSSSADGVKLVANSNGYLYTSTDSGLTWTARAHDRYWWCVASSADGTKLVAGATAEVYTSTDSGVSWAPRGMTNYPWLTVASSSDGTRLVLGGDWIYTSKDSGASWGRCAGALSWTSVACSADGFTILAAVGDAHTGVTFGQLYTSNDFGVSWTARESMRDWASVACSSDGTKLVAVARGGRIYTSTASTTEGDAGSLVGTQGSAVELQYVGNGRFFPLSHSGTLEAY